MAVSIAAAEAVINTVAANGVANGTHYVNTASPLSSHVREAMKWLLRARAPPDAPVQATLVECICAMARVELDAAGTTAEANKVPVEVAVLASIARLAFARYTNLDAAGLTASETTILPAATAALVVHADHEAAVSDALKKWANFAPRLMAIGWYNAISFETADHHHLPAKTRKLARTTMALTGLTELLATTADGLAEGCLYHDMFHPLSVVKKSMMARDRSAKPALEAIKYSNLAKRIPVKAGDCGVAINYPALYRKSVGYSQNAGDIPATMVPPAAVTDAIAAYEAAATTAALTAAVARLRAMSLALAEPSVYLAGYMLGKDRRSSENPDLTLREAKVTNTILGSPAYQREAGENPGTFALGISKGYAAVAAAALTAANAAKITALGDTVAGVV